MERKHFLDWLRVGAFALLIMFHAGLLYTSWDFTLKSPRLVPGVEPWLLTFSTWRMPLLFLISGVACRFLIGKLGPGGFTLDRVRRLLPVILFGMLVVIPPQVYVEFVAKGVTQDSYWRFWLFDYLAVDRTLAPPPGRTMPTWDHLWFIVYLLVYAPLFALALAAARPLRSVHLPLAVLLIAPALWLAAGNVIVQRWAPLTWALVDDWGGHFKWLGMFATGALFATRDDLWAWLRDHRGWLAIAAAGLVVVQTLSSGLAWPIAAGVYGWAAICAVCGYAARFLDRPSAPLAHLNDAVLPVYVLHQPILLIAAFLIFPLRLPLPLEALSLVAITFAGSFAIYEAAIRPWRSMRFLLGLKPQPN